MIAAKLARLLAGVPDWAWNLLPSKWQIWVLLNGKWRVGK